MIFDVGERVKCRINYDWGATGRGLKAGQQGVVVAVFAHKADGVFPYICVKWDDGKEDPGWWFSCPEKDKFDTNTNNLALVGGRKMQDDRSYYAELTGD